MGKHCTVNASMSNLSLFGLGVFKGGQTVDLTDAEYNSLSSAQQTTWFSSVSTITDPARPVADTLNTLTTKVATITSQTLGRTGPLLRQRNNFRRLGPITTDLTSVSNTTSTDATLTNKYSVSIGSRPAGTISRMSDAEYAAVPWVQSPYCGENPRVWNNSGFGYVLDSASNLSTDETYLYPSVNIQRFETMTDAPVIEFGLYAYLGLATTSIQAYVDGSPVTLVPQTVAGSIYFYKITFPAGKKPRLVEVSTESLLTWISVAPSYKCWKPPARRGPKVMVLGASYVAPVIYNSSTGAQTFLRYGPWAQMDAYLDIDQCPIEGISGTGFLTNASGGIGYPNNTYADRVAGIIKTKPDVLIWADSFSNDLHTGKTTDAIIASVESCVDQVMASLPNCRQVFQTGLRTPLYGDYTASYDIIKTALKARYPGKHYYIDVRNVIDQAGGYTPGHTTGTGNGDYYIGTDGIHPTKEGGDYLRGRLYPAIQKVLWDDGSLAGTEIPV